MANTASPEAPPAEPTRKSRGTLALVKAIAAVSIIVLIEVAAAAMLFPTADETRAIGEQLARGEKKSADGGHAALEGEHAEGAHGGPAEHTREVSLGIYHIVSFNPKTGTSLSVDFELYGAVLANEEPEFNELFTVHEKRIGEQVTIAVRGTDVADFTDPGLGLIKRIILEKTNRALGKPLIREIIVNQFSWLER